METTDAVPTQDSVRPLAVLGGPQRLRSRRWRAFRRNRLAVASAVFLTVLVFTAVFGNLLAPSDPAENNLREAFARPGSPGHLLGADDLGRDLFSRLLVGTRVSLMAGLGAVLVALGVALPFGLAVGYFGGLLDSVVMRVVDIVLSIPPLILVFAVAGILGRGLGNAVAALGVYFTPVFIRLIRSEVRTLRSSQMVEAEIGVGAPHRYIMVRHVLPAIVSPLIVQVSLSVGVAILAEASLSFLGLGVSPPTASWGVMLRSAFTFISTESWMVFIPGLAIASTVLALNLLGDGLRDAFGRVGT